MPRAITATWPAGRGPGPARYAPGPIEPGSTPRVEDEAALAAAATAAVADLRRRKPEASAAMRMSRRQAHAGALAGLSLVLLAWLSPGWAWTLVSVSAAVVFFAASLVRLAAVLTPRRAPPPPFDAGPGARDWPIYTVIVAAYREAAVMADLVAALTRLDYPSSRLQILLALEADDAETIAAARTAARRAARDPTRAPTVEIVVCPPGTPRTKPRALNIALAFALGDFVAVYDAEDRPDPAQLRAALGAFAAGPARLACVQAPLNWWNGAENWITRQFVLEYAAHFEVVLPALARWGWALPLGGTSNHFRTDVLRTVGAWDPYNVTEDADLGFRLAAEGYTTGVIAPRTLEEAPARLWSWTRQRSRWIKGHLLTWTVHMRAPGRLWRGGGLGAHAALQLLVGASALSSVVHAPVFAILAIVSLLQALGATGEARWVAGWHWGLLGFGYVAGLAAVAAGLARIGKLGHLIFAPLAPVYWHLHSLAGAKAVADIFSRPHHWEKTEHGLSTLRPRAAAQDPASWSSASPSPAPSSRSPSPGSRAVRPPVRRFRRAGLASSPGAG